METMARDDNVGIVLFFSYCHSHFPVNMPKHALTGPEPDRCYRHRPGSGPVKAGYDVFTVFFFQYSSRQVNECRYDVNLELIYWKHMVEIIIGVA